MIPSTRVLSRSRRPLAAEFLAAGRRHHASTSAVPADTSALWLQRKCSCGGACPSCRAKEEAEEKLKPQTKLKVSSTHDRYEQEADRVAENVMRMPAPGGTQTVESPGEELVQTKPRITPLVQRQTEPEPAEDEQPVQPKAASADKPTGGAKSLSPGTVLQGGGRPLPSSSRRFFEPRLGCDLSQIRVHADARAAQSARDLGALAYTLGKHVVFAAGQYTPHSDAGRRLLAHELVHVVQQSGGSAETVQRQPDFRFDPCVETPQGKLCGSDAVSLCEKAPSLPGCGAVCKLFGCKKPSTPSASCPPGFRAATSSGFRGQCCLGTIDSQQACCPPARAASADHRCCGADQVVVAGKCVNPDDLPPLPPTLRCLPWQQTISGECCDPPLVPLGARCVLPAPPAPPPTPVTPPITPTVPAAIEIPFRFDRPKAGETAASALAASLEQPQGRAGFDDLVSRLQADPALRVQLVGRASPEGSDDYNLQLGARRARLIKAALIEAGIDASRIADPVSDDLDAGCQTVETGLATCGKLNATGERDRQVLARVFPGS